jgi:hypothetical protein
MALPSIHPPPTYKVVAYSPNVAVALVHYLLLIIRAPS